MNDLIDGVKILPEYSGFANQSVQVMTVHSSKGLEFDHVFLPYLNKGSRSSLFSQVIVNEQRCQIFAKTPVLSPFKNEFSPYGVYFRSEFVNSELREVERLLYVAMTRAKESIYMSSHFKGSPKKGSMRSFFPDDIDIEIEVIEEIKEQSQTDFSLDYFAQDSVKLENLFHDPQVTLSATQFSKKVMQTESDHRDIYKGESHFLTSLMSIQKGNDFHRWAESLAGKSKDELVQSFQDSTFSSLVSNEKIPLLEILEKGESEFGFNFNKDTFYFEGQIDLFGRDRSGRFWIVDYKTGSLSQRELYFWQLNFYQFSLKQTQVLPEQEEVNLALLQPYKNEIQIETSKDFNEVWNSIKWVAESIRSELIENQ